MDEAQKIIYFSDAIFLGGAEEYLKLLVPEINRQRYLPRVVLSPTPATLHLAEFFEKQAIPVDLLETHHSLHLQNFFGPLRYFLKERPSIVHFNLNNSFGCFFPILAAFCAGVPWRLATEHLAFELTSGKRAGVHTKKLVKKIMTFCLHYTIAVSQANKRLLVRDYKIDPIHIKLIRNCVDVSKYRFSIEGREQVRREFGISEDQVLVGTVARFSYQKGHEYTVEAIPSVLKAFPHARFLFVGKGPESERILYKTQNLGVQDYVFFAGDRRDIVNVLSAMDVFLLTSIFEGLPLSVLEAMVVGLPVIATRVSGTPEAVLHQMTGLLIPPADSTAVARALAEMLANPEERQRMGRQGRLQALQRFHKKYLVKQINDFYDQLIDASRQKATISLSLGTKSPKASIIILSWNKKELLSECLDAVILAVEAERGDHEIILVDNGSTDGTQDYMRTHYPQVRLIELDKNYRFCRANNIGVKCAKNEIVVLLNNDVIVDRNFLRPLLQGFESPDIFAVTSQIFNYDQSKTREETGKTFGTLVFGCVHVGHTPPNERDEERQYVPVFYAGGGSSAYHRGKFLDLGGFDEVYNPGYVEDADVSYRAWKAGYRVLFCPASKVIHKHRSTNATKLGNRRIDYLISRNLFVFFWQNVTSPSLFVKHLCQLPMRILLDLSRGRFAILRAFLGALLKVPRIVWNRRNIGKLSQLSDQETLAAINNWFFYRHNYLLNGRAEASSRKILLISKRLPKLGFDGSWILVNLIQGLSKHHEITLLSFMETDAEKPHADYLRQFCKEVKTITLYPYSDELKSSFLFSKIFALINAFLLMRKEVLNHLKKEDYDLVQCEYLHTLNFIPNLSRYPSLLTHHEVLSLARERSFRGAPRVTQKVSRFFRWKVTQFYEKRVCLKVKSVATLSSVDREYLQAKLSVRAPHLVRTGVDTEYFKPCPGCVEIPNSLIFVGYFKHPPNVEALHYFFGKIWPCILQSVPGARMTVVGRFAPPEVLAYSQKDVVTFTDFVPDLRPHLQRHSVFVAPIVSGAGLRGKILEALAMGKAVVATSLCVEGYPFVHGCELMIAHDAEEFARNTVTLLNDPACRARLGRQGRAIVEKQFGSRHFTEAYENLHAELFQ
jgi:glycosyltransferase involved in cell wall biosynthesis/GT2 family glycosyltransferase